MVHREIFLCLSDGNRAFWIRYLLSTRKETQASFMIAMFDKDGSSGYRTPYETFSLNPYGKTYIGGNAINTMKRHASDIENSYSLNWLSSEAETSAISGVTRLLDLKSRYVLLSPNALFNGWVTYLGEFYNIKDYRGMVGYISQLDYLSHWTWMHMFSSKEGNMWVDLLISDREFGGRKIALFSGRINERLIHPFFPTLFSGSTDISGIEGVLNVAGKKFIIHSHTDKNTMIKVKYDAVRKHDSYCYNSELATTSIEHEGRTYFSSVSFFENGTMDNLDGFREATITNIKR